MRDLSPEVATGRFVLHWRLRAPGSGCGGGSVNAKSCVTGSAPYSLLFWRRSTSDQMKLLGSGSFLLRSPSPATIIVFLSLSPLVLSLALSLSLFLLLSLSLSALISFLFYSAPTAAYRFRAHEPVHAWLRATAWFACRRSSHRLLCRCHSGWARVYSPLHRPNSRLLPQTQHRAGRRISAGNRSRASQRNRKVPSAPETMSFVREDPSNWGGDPCSGLGSTGRRCLRVEPGNQFG